MDLLNDRYDVESAIIRARKGKGRTKLRIAIMALIIGYYIAWVILEGQSSEITLGGVFLGVMACFYFLVILRNARKRCELAGIIIKTDDDGILAWDDIKRREIRRLSFANMAKIYWPPSGRVTYITIVGMKEGKEKLHYFSKLHMESQSYIKELLAGKAELIEEALSKEEQQNYQ